jgi:hypothetical protein
MRIRLPRMSEETRAKRARLREARENLVAVNHAEIRKGIRHETPEFWAANDAVAEAERGLPWYKRIDIDTLIG